MADNTSYDIFHAIIALDPSATISVVGEDYDQITWGERGNSLGITIDQIKEKQVELKAEYDSKEYSRNRATAYASTGDQLDMQYWDSVNDTTTWKDHVASVKTQFPKP